jgi:hypothetical protein
MWLELVESMNKTNQIPHSVGGQPLLFSIPLPSDHTGEHHPTQRTCQGPRWLAGRHAHDRPVSGRATASSELPWQGRQRSSSRPQGVVQGPGGDPKNGVIVVLGSSCGWCDEEEPAIACVELLSWILFFRCCKRNDGFVLFR